MEQANGEGQTTKIDELESSGFIVIPIKGISMQPLLYTHTSYVLIHKLEGKPKKNDVVLYVRPDGVQVLHRIMGFDGDICLIRGDNTFFHRAGAIVCCKRRYGKLLAWQRREKRTEGNTHDRFSVSFVCVVLEPDLSAPLPET